MMDKNRIKITIERKKTKIKDKQKLVIDKINNVNGRIGNYVHGKRIFKETIMFCLLAILMFVGFYSLYYFNRRVSVGIDAVNDMYNFTELTDLGKNMDKLKTITTSEVYNQLTVANKERALNTYLKFKGEPVAVEIVKSEYGYVLYTLNTDSLSRGRKFLFLYSVGLNGKINSQREMECIDFYNDNGEPANSAPLPETPEELEKALSGS